MCCKYAFQEQQQVLNVFLRPLWHLCWFVAVAVAHHNVFPTMARNLYSRSFSRKKRKLFWGNIFYAKGEKAVFISLCGFHWIFYSMIWQSWLKTFEGRESKMMLQGAVHSVNVQVSGLAWGDTHFKARISQAWAHFSTIHLFVCSYHWFFSLFLTFPASFFCTEITFNAARQRLWCTYTLTGLRCESFATFNVRMTNFGNFVSLYSKILMGENWPSPQTRGKRKKLAGKRSLTFPIAIFFLQVELFFLQCRRHQRRKKTCLQIPNVNDSSRTIIILWKSPTKITINNHEMWPKSRQ